MIVPHLAVGIIITLSRHGIPRALLNAIVEPTDLR